MKTYTDEQLKWTLAKMLPDKTTIGDCGNICWIDEDMMGDHTVLDTELLHLCWLVWNALTRLQRMEYSLNLFEVVKNSGGHAASTYGDILHCCENATWQQRATALAKTKGIKIV